MKWKPVDIIIVMLVVTLCFAVVTASIAPMYDYKPLTEGKAKALAGVVGSMVSIISLYVGAKIK